MSKFEQKNASTPNNNKNVQTKKHKPLVKSLQEFFSSTSKPTETHANQARQNVQLETPKKSILFETIEPRVLMSADPVLNVSAAISTPGEVDQYNFTATTDIKVVFDALTNDPNMSWKLTGPQGAVVVDPRSFTASDAAGLSGTPAIDLAAGDYTLSVDASAGATGAYQFRLLNLRTADVMTPGVPVIGQLSPGNETDAYKFDVVQGERFNFDLQGNGVDSASWRLLDPSGQQIYQSNFVGSANEYPQALASSGTYTLLIEGSVSSNVTVNYTLNVQATPEVLFSSITPNTVLPMDSLNFSAAFSEDQKSVV